MGQADYFYFFVTRGVENLGNSSRLGYITARYFIEAYFASGFRQFLQQSTIIDSVVDFQNYTVFKDVGTKTCLLFVQKEDDARKRLSNEINVCRLPDRHTLDEQVAVALASRPLEIPFERIEFPQSQLLADRWVFIPADERALVAKVEDRAWLLGEKCRIGMGMQTGSNTVFEVSPQTIQEYGIEPQVLRKVVSNMEIKRYVVNFNERYWIYTEPYGEEAPKLFPNTMRYLAKHRSRLEDRIAFRRGDCKWYQFSYPRHVDKYDSPKILVPFIAPSNRFALDQAGDIYSSTDSQVIFPLVGFPVSLEFVVALLNSHLLNWRYRYLGKLKDYRYEYSREAISALPIRRIAFTTPPEERARLVGVGITEATEWIEGPEGRSVDSVTFNAFSDSKLARWLHARLSAEPEQAGVVHDLLAHLAGRMIEMHKAKQAEVRGFLDWLAGYTGLPVDDWVLKTNLRRYYEHDWAEMQRVLKRNQRKLPRVALDVEAYKNEPAARIRAAWETSMETLRPLLARIAATDRLIDQVVYHLYGLTEEEIAVVEGTP